VKNRAYLSLGSNMDKERNLPCAVAMLRSAGSLLAISQAYETAPVGSADQPSFLNAAVLLETELSARDLKQGIIAGIESRLGRIRNPQDKNAPRTIDIDISLWNDEVTEVLDQPIPDPDILRFAHVAVPLAEIAPDLIHPQEGQSLARIAEQLACRAPGLQPRTDVRLNPDSG
jgi:2-amino-4-hydroxy-6-hydroxymethyldihydropteridine diphosphokinase